VKSRGAQRTTVLDGGHDDPPRRGERSGGKFRPFSTQERLTGSRSFLRWKLWSPKANCTRRERDSMRPSPNYFGHLLRRKHRLPSVGTITFSEVLVLCIKITKFSFSRKRTLYKFRKFRAKYIRSLLRNCSVCLIFGQMRPEGGSRFLNFGCLALLVYDFCNVVPALQRGWQ